MSNIFLLACNGPYENHGCEAIVRGTLNILNRAYNRENYYIEAGFFYSHNQFLRQKMLEKDKSIKLISHNTYERLSKEWFLSKFKKYNNLDPYINDCKAVLSIGGDNYSLDYGFTTKFTDNDDYVLSKRKPLIIWGASVGPFTKDKEYEEYMSRHLKKVTAIFARESETVRYLNNIGINENVYKTSDPAFILEAEKPLNLKKDIEKGAIGINISPLMINYITKGNKSEFIRLSIKIIERIIASTGKTIYFIPHVVIKGCSDYEIMNTIYNNLDEKLKEKIIRISDKLNASEYKWIISRMEVFFGARTHATIAAMSSAVPTVSFVYSIKSLGLNKDMFGSDKYCVYPDQYNEDFLMEKIKYLIDNKKEISSDLMKAAERSKESALKAGEYLKNIISE